MINKPANVQQMHHSLQTLRVFNAIFLNTLILFLKAAFLVPNIKYMILVVIAVKIALMINLGFVSIDVWSALLTNIITKHHFPVSRVLLDFCTIQL
jgi:hypothetical protein